MAARDPEVNIALRHTRSAIRKLRAAARSLDVAAGWWQDVDNHLFAELRRSAEAVMDMAAKEEGEVRDAYPSRGYTPKPAEGFARGEYFVPLHLRTDRS